jgi:glutathione S-transferase
MNPLRKTHVLVGHDGSVLIDSSIIIEYLGSIGLAKKFTENTPPSLWH